MILHTSADAVYFDVYFDLWAGQAHKIYPDIPKHIALWAPTEDMRRKCQATGVRFSDFTAALPAKPDKRHFFLLRWLGLPHWEQQKILSTQITCIAVRPQVLPDLDIDHLRICRPKKGGLGGICAALFSAEAARRVSKQAATWVQSPPPDDHDMNVWHGQNLSTCQIPGEAYFKSIEAPLPTTASWVTAGSSAQFTHQEKLRILKHYVAVADKAPPPMSTARRRTRSRL